MSDTRLERLEMRMCKSSLPANCQLSLEQVENLQGNPSGVGKPDVANPNYVGKVRYVGGKLSINLSYVLTGNISRADAALANIRKVYGDAGIEVNLAPSSRKFDLRIHGATLAELAQGLSLCDCKSALYIGGWAPNPRHPIWGNALLVNPHSDRRDWRISDAHEFGHKLGLKHRTDVGIMDYPPKTAVDMRKFKPSDKQRIIDLYK
ncbi:hypothetical protein [Cellvibrio sp. PSBB023]|uniref:hypothetical protein n=1 Tax=Cellvibrio sp. PSBB023 TaxID=1945512 RepID=UPI00098ED25A|nr:hypothetical protein [Cellvibrio sp. PSBB023]AQT59048.1 hypothetical protein B0D95_02325 [Cellvibrio sp. PSBB023]